MSTPPLTQAIIIPGQVQNTEDSPLLDLVSDLFTTDQSLQLENQKTQEAFQKFMTEMKTQFAALSEANSLLRKEQVAAKTQKNVSDGMHERKLTVLKKQNAVLRNTLAEETRQGGKLNKELTEEKKRNEKLQESHDLLMEAISVKDSPYNTRYHKIIQEALKL